MLDRLDEPRREGAAVADPIDLEDRRHPGVSGPEKVGVQRVGDATLHGAAGGDEALREHLATEETAAAVPRILPAKQVHLDALEIEVRDEPVERITHARARVADFRLGSGLRARWGGTYDPGRRCASKLDPGRSSSPQTKPSRLERRRRDAPRRASEVAMKLPR